MCDIVNYVGQHLLGPIVAAVIRGPLAALTFRYFGIPKEVAEHDARAARRPLRVDSGSHNVSLNVTEGASFLGWTMRAKLLVISVAMAAGLVATLVAPNQAAARDGRIVVREKITLNFPSPGVYRGKVFNLEAKVKQIATRARFKAASAKEKKRARGAALGACKRTISERQVTVLHLSKPPFRIGVDAPTKYIGTYLVSGPQPPKGDPVKGFQSGTSKQVRSGTPAARYRWRVQCMGAQVTKPYPY